MSIAYCPMCHSPISAELTARSCASCGADLARFMSKPAQPPLLASPEPIISKPGSTGEFNLGLGILGAFLGACAGVGLMFGFYEFVGFRFPLLGVGIGALTGIGGRKFFKGTDHSLGLICGGIALVAVVATLYLMYGEFPVWNIISVVVSVSVAYQISAHS